LAADSVVDAAPVVEVIPHRQRSPALVGVLVGAAVCPFAKRRLDESLGFAVGLRPVASRELLIDAEILARLDERLGMERRALVCDQAL
jgi:hypothetical protein